MTEEDLRKDYEKRKGTVDALLETGLRIDEERGTSHPEFAKVKSMIGEAEGLAAAGKYAEGKMQLDRAYALLKKSLHGMLSRKEAPKKSKESGRSASGK